MKPPQIELKVCDPMESWWSRLSNFGKPTLHSLRIEQLAALNPHILTLGDSGVGKSTLLHQICSFAERNGQTAVIYDYKGEFIETWYRAERGDVILNIQDQDFPFYSLSAEIVDPLIDPLTIAYTLIPETKNGNTFWDTSNRQLLAHLIKAYRPTTQELVVWLSSPDTLKAKLAGTPFESIFEGKEMKLSVHYSLQTATHILKLFPPKNECRSTWSANEWAKSRKGWIFISPTAQQKDTLLPIISLWLDLLIVRMLSSDRDWAKQNPVWLILDEVHTLRKINKLPEAVFIGRDSGINCCIGGQGKNQLFDNYGKVAGDMLSTPALKFLFATSEPDAAAWNCDLISDQITTKEQVDASETVLGGLRDSVRYSTKTERKNVLLKAEVGGLPKTQCFLKFGNFVTQVQFPIVVRQKRRARFIERPNPSF